MKLFRTWTFQWWEMGMLKVSLISLGILTGLYFREYLIGLTALWWVLFVAFALYFIVKMFRDGTPEDKAV